MCVQSIQVASLASATPSVAYTRSLTWAWWVHSLQLLRVWLTLASLAHSHGRDEAGRECDILVITCTKWLRARAAHNMGNLWQCWNVHKKPPSIAPSLPPSVPACLPACCPACLLAGRPKWIFVTNTVGFQSTSYKDSAIFQLNSSVTL